MKPRFIDLGGRNPIISTPDELWEKFVEYRTWVDENPILEENLFHHQGDITRANKKKMRAMTQKAFSNFMGIDPTTWRDWRNNRDDLSAIIAYIDNAIFCQKFEGAAAGVLKSDLIARELNLAETVRTENLTPPAQPDCTDSKTIADIVHPDATNDELSAIYTAGLEPMLYSENQIDAGMKWIMPIIPEAQTDDCGRSRP